MGMNEISWWAFYCFLATTEHSIFRKLKESKSKNIFFLAFYLSIQTKQVLPEETAQI